MRLATRIDWIRRYYGDSIPERPEGKMFFVELFTISGESGLWELDHAKADKTMDSVEALWNPSQPYAGRIPDNSTGKLVTFNFRRLSNVVVAEITSALERAGILGDVEHKTRTRKRKVSEETPVVSSVEDNTG